MTDSPRRLIAIMFTDIVGYSAMTQRDEGMTLHLLDEHNKLVRAALASHAGREIKTVGDAFLVAFESALEAVRCAIRIQANLKERNAVNTVPIQLRIGIHLGDVVYRDGDVFGDGVNIAARVQSSAEAGEIRISEDVARQVANKIEYRLRDLGLMPLKNIDQPMRLFALGGLLSEPDDHPADVAVALDALGEKVALAPEKSRGTWGMRMPPVQRWALVSGGVALVAMLTVAAVFGFQRFSRTSEISSVAILPFENASGDNDMDYLSNGISESLINKLSGVSGLRVLSRSATFAFKGKKSDPLEIGRKLDVDALVLGSLVQRGAELSISTELVRVSNASQLWGEKYSRHADDVLKVEGEIATTIAQTLRRHLSGEERAKLAKNVTSDPEAYRLYLKGRDFLQGSKREMDKGIEYFQLAAQKAPDYAMAYAGLAGAYTTQATLRGTGRTEVLEKAKVAVNRALELDPNLAEAHTALGLIRAYFDWDWKGADAEFRRGIELNPNSAAVHAEYGFILNAWGRLEDALVQSQAAVRLDPLSPQLLHDIGYNYFLRGNYDQAAKYYRDAQAVDPNWVWAHLKLARSEAAAKRCPEAMSEVAISERLLGGSTVPTAWSFLGVTYALCGNSVRAREYLAQLHALEAKRYVDPLLFADIHFSLGELDESIRWLEKGFNDRSPLMIYAPTIQLTNPGLANDGRLKSLLDRMAFPKW